MMIGLSMSVNCEQKCLSPKLKTSAVKSISMAMKFVQIFSNKEKNQTILFITKFQTTNLRMFVLIMISKIHEEAADIKIPNIHS